MTDTAGAAMPAEVASLLASRPQTPCLVLHLPTAVEQLARLRAALPAGTEIHYAVKANDAAPLLRVLASAGCRFEVASLPEIRAALAAGGVADELVLGAPAAPRVTVQAAAALGVATMVVDTAEQLDKLVGLPVRVAVRVAASGAGAGWPLGRKHGCSPQAAAQLLVRARDLGLTPYGLAVHPGSQQVDVTAWRRAVAGVASALEAAAAAGCEPRWVDLGGGFPVRYARAVPDLEQVCGALTDAVRELLPADVTLAVEPGRYLAAPAGWLHTEVLLAAAREDGERWVYVDAGVYAGLTESSSPAITLPPVPDGRAVSPVVLAGPTCDSADIAYDSDRADRLCLPDELADGDRVTFAQAGAYTSAYSAHSFNGLPAVAVHCVPVVMPAAVLRA